MKNESAKDRIVVEEVGSLGLSAERGAAQVTMDRAMRTFEDQSSDDVDLSLMASDCDSEDGGMVVGDLQTHRLEVIEEFGIRGASYRARAVGCERSGIKKHATSPAESDKVAQTARSVFSRSRHNSVVFEDDDVDSAPAGDDTNSSTPSEDENHEDAHHVAPTRERVFLERTDKYPFLQDCWASLRRDAADFTSDYIPFDLLGLTVIMLYLSRYTVCPLVLSLLRWELETCERAIVGLYSVLEDSNFAERGQGATLSFLPGISMFRSDGLVFFWTSFVVCAYWMHVEFVLPSYDDAQLSDFKSKSVPGVSVSSTLEDDEDAAAPEQMELFSGYHLVRFLETMRAFWLESVLLGALFWIWSSPAEGPFVDGRQHIPHAFLSPAQMKAVAVCILTILYLGCCGDAHSTILHRQLRKKNVGDSSFLCNGLSIRIRNVRDHFNEVPRMLHRLRMILCQFVAWPWIFWHSIAAILEQSADSYWLPSPAFKTSKIISSSAAQSQKGQAIKKDRLTGLRQTKAVIGAGDVDGDSEGEDLGGQNKPWTRIDGARGDGEEWAAVDNGSLGNGVVIRDGNGPIRFFPNVLQEFVPNISIM